MEIKYHVENMKLYLDYSLNGDKYKSCINGKAYYGFTTNGYIGLTSGNPVFQNVNEIDVHKIDFFNMNPEYYKHDGADIVEEQSYYKRDENGFVGKTVYPWQAKLNTIELGKVAYDILELKRNQREYFREQFARGLHIVKKEDDLSEVMYKLNEQIRLLNDDIVGQITLQAQKKQSILDFERMLMTDEDYKKFIDHVKSEDKVLYEISQKFSDLTVEAKKILDEIKAKSDDRKQKFGVRDDDIKVENHHKPLPQEIKQELLEAAQLVNSLHSAFDDFTKRTNEAVSALQASQNRVLQDRKQSSITGNDNIFTRLKETKEDRAKQVFGKRGRGVYKDSTLNAIEEKVQQRSERLEAAIKSRQSNEQFISGMLTLMSVISLVFVWTKLKKSMSSKLILGGFGGSQKTQAEHYI